MGSPHKKVSRRPHSDRRDSAGGNLALCLTQKLQSENRPLPGALLLFSLWTDMTSTSGSYETYKDRDPILTKDYVMNAAKAYMPEGADPKDAKFSPLFGNLKGLPPMLIMSGRNEILLYDSLRLRDRVVEEGGQAVLDEDLGSVISCVRGFGYADRENEPRVRRSRARLRV